MATTRSSNWTYHSSSDTSPIFSSRLHQPPPESTMFVSGGYHDEILERQIEQARQQRTGFYRRLADAGRRGGNASTETPSVTVPDISATTVGGSNRRAELSSGMGRRKLRHSEETSGLETTDKLSTSVDNVRGHYDPLVFTDITSAETPKPQTSWRYYTTYDKDTNEWRRNAVPVFKTDESGSGQPSSSARTETVSDSKSSAFDRHCRARGCAGLLQSTTASRPLSGNDSRRARSEEVTASLHYNGLDGEFSVDHADVSGMGDGGPYGGHRTVRPYVDDLMRKILGESWRRPTDTSSNEEKVIYANSSRTSILDDGVPAAAAPVKVEIPEGDDESKFVEKTLAPSGRPWVSVPSLSERILMMSTVAEGDENEVAGGTDGVDSFSDTRRAAVMDWLKGSAEGSVGEAATVMPFGVGSSTRVQLAPVRSETTVHAETRTTVEKIGGDRSTALARSTADSGNVEGGWRQPTSFVEQDRYCQRSGNSSPFGVDRIVNEKSTKISSHCEDDVIWIPVIHVPDPVDASSGSAADSVKVKDRESSTQQRVLSATSWSKQMPPVNTSTQSVTSGSDLIKSRSTSSSPVIIRPTAVMANSGSSCSSRQSEVSPTLGVASKESGTYSSSISLHTADRPSSGIRGSATNTSHGKDDSDERSRQSLTCATEATSIAPFGSGERGGGFRSVAVTGTGAWKANPATALVGDRQQTAANGGRNVGVYRSETCFSVDAVETPDLERIPSSTVPSISSLNETGNRTWQTPSKMISGVQQVPVNASSVTSTDWRHSSRSAGLQPTSGVCVSSVRQFDSSSADTDDGDWVIEKAL